MRREKGGTPGLLLGIFGCVFGVLGILSFGLLFTPIAALFSLLGLLAAMGGLSPAGMLVSLVGCFLTVTGFVVSPSLWILAVGLSGTSVPAKDRKEPEPVEEPMPLPPSRSVSPDWLQPLSTPSAGGAVGQSKPLRCVDQPGESLRHHVAAERIA